MLTSHGAPRHRAWYSKTREYFPILANFMDKKAQFWRPKIGNHIINKITNNSYEIATRSPPSSRTTRNARRLIRKLSAFRGEWGSVSPTPVAMDNPQRLALRRYRVAKEYRGPCFVKL